MISPNDIQVTKTDLTLFATVFVVANVVENQLLKTPLFNEKWMNLSVGFLLGVALHGLVTNKISSVINNQLAISNAGVRASIYDVVKFGTFFATQRVVVSYIEGKPVVLDQKWFTEVGAIIAGYSVFTIAIQNAGPQVSDDLQPLVNDIIKVSMGALAGNYVVDGTINKNHLMLLGTVLSGFTAFHLVTKRFVVPKEKFSQIGGTSVHPDQ